MDLIEKTIKEISPLDGQWQLRAQSRLDNLTKPQGSLGRLEEFARRLVAIAEKENPSLDKKAIFVFAGDHGVTAEGVSAYPKEVTAQMIYNFLQGGAGINVLARHAGAEVVVVDMGVDHDFGELAGLIHRKVLSGTRNFTSGPALTAREARRCLEIGIELADDYAKKDGRLLGTGDMGIGNTTPAAAIAAVITRRPVKEVTGRGTGITDAALKKKIAVIEAGINFNNPDPEDALDILAKVGGAEIGGIAGLILGAAKNRVPMVIDGFISTAGALVAHKLCPLVGDYIFAAHNSQEIGHKAMLEKMALSPILDLDLRLGEGTGAALAMLIIEGGLKIYREMATFGEAGVSTATDA